MCRLDGQISVRNLSLGFALASQEPWIQHASIRDNILFGREFSSRRYEKVLDAAALLDDLKVTAVNWLLLVELAFGIHVPDIVTQHIMFVRDPFLFLI